MGLLHLQSSVTELVGSVGGGGGGLRPTVFKFI